MCRIYRVDFQAGIIGSIFKQEKAKGLLTPPLRFTSDGRAGRKRRV